MWRKRKRLIVLVSVTVVLAAAVGVWALRSGEGALIRQLRSGDPDERLAAIRGLEQIGSAAAAKAIAGTIGDGDSRVASGAVGALGHMGRAEYLAYVRSAAGDGRQDVRAAAADAMSGFGEKADVEVLVKGLEDPDPKGVVRAAAASSLGRLEAYGAMPALVKALEDPSPIVRGRAAAAVKNILQIDLGYRAGDPPEKRAAAIARINLFYPTIARKHADYIRRMRENKSR
jgi:HEAT repeat protein